MSKRVLVGMSGGVDSAVAALLLCRAGYEVCGVTLKLLPHGGEQEIADAAHICESLGIPHRVEPLIEDFQRLVMDAFAESYIEGLTPNPCLLCNRYIKFGKLWELARGLGMDYLATGHYARIFQENGRHTLGKAKDARKDQSYFLYGIDKDILPKVLFPLGEYGKEEVRAMALENGLVNARKRDSQDICFVKDGDYAAFIETHTGKSFPGGPFIDGEGRRLGTHRGLIHYTVGQRKGLGLAMGRPIFVCRKNVEENTVTLGESEDLLSTRLTAHDVRWLTLPPAEPIRIAAKVRFNQPPQSAVAEPLPGGLLAVTFETPQRAIAPGQSVVLYDGDMVLGGGIID